MIQIYVSSVIDAGADTVEANLQLGFDADHRSYDLAAAILRDLGVTSVRLMTNNPAKYGGIAGYGLSIVERVQLDIAPTPENEAYLRTKRDRMGNVSYGSDIATPKKGK